MLWGKQQQCFSMLIDLRAVEANQTFEAPICILGAGVAGLTLARRLLSLGWPVLLVESGGLDFEAPVQQLATGRSVGHEYYPLDAIGLRMLGGTTAIWGGRCAELDPIDFEARPWVPHSGWPLSHDDLRPYYQRALEIFQVPAPQAGRQAMARRLPLLEELDGDDLAVGCWSFDDVADRFAAPRIGDVVDHPNCRVLIHATATALALDASGGAVTSARLADVSGKNATVVARHFILALGGVENPRLLLASRDLATAGIGNAHDLVGRFFMEHPHARGGSVRGPAMWELLRSFGRRHRVDTASHAALLRLSEECQRRLGCLNSALTLGLRQPECARQALIARSYAALKHNFDATVTNRRLWRATKRTARRLNELTYPLRPWLAIKSGRAEVAVIIRAEQAPNPHSRVRLGNDVDALGMPRVELDWNFTALDKTSVRTLVDTLGGTLERGRLGGLRRAEWLDEDGPLWHTDAMISAHPIGGYHHMGTTRMADDPAQGVVDRHGRVHGVANLHVAGSSVFPTAGWANPTLTIAALALRLADRFGAFAAAP